MKGERINLTLQLRFHFLAGVQRLLQLEGQLSGFVHRSHFGLRQLAADLHKLRFALFCRLQQLLLMLLLQRGAFAAWAARCSPSSLRKRVSRSDQASWRA